MLQRIYNALSKNTLQEVELKKVQLSRVSDWIAEAKGSIEGAVSMEYELEEVLYQALQYARALDVDSKRAEGLYMDGTELLVEIQDLGLDAPPELEEHIVLLKSLYEKDTQQILNSLKNVEQII